MTAEVRNSPPLIGAFGEGKTFTTVHFHFQQQQQHTISPPLRPTLFNFSTVYL
jgi:hypothetical protein